ncbi:hypothetical protein CW703_05315 [Candidatus Bathyarchaeota archaeon]|nr:MAG: hypothetical protein CW703_05315 [Candidatus Bathyarchaeota archaeon]
MNPYLLPLIFTVGDLFQQLTNGEWLEAIFGAYTGTMGDFFWLILFVTIQTAIYIRSQSLALLGIVTIVLWSAMVTVMPIEFAKIGFYTVILIATYLIFRLIHGRVE